MQSIIGEIYKGTVTGLTSFGAFIRLSNGETGMVHISEVSSSYVREIRDFLTEGQAVRVKVINVGDNRRISLSIKQAEAGYQSQPTEKPREPQAARTQPLRKNVPSGGRFSEKASGGMNFEEMMAKFKKDSDEKISVLHKNADARGGGKRGGRS